MNLVFVNHMHPSTPHVSGMRSWFFARELAMRGHRVVQLCEWREGTEPALPPAALAPCLQQHDWSEPMLLAIQPQRRALLEIIRSVCTPSALRKALVSWSYLRHSGMFTDFSQATLPYQLILTEMFRPQATWGLFGNTDCWLIAQQLARRSACPWVADMKDSWEVFIQPPLRSVLIQRFQDMAACTANAVFNANVLQRWCPPEPTVVYSGVDPCFLTEDHLAKDPDCFRLTLTGGLYSDVDLNSLVNGMLHWLRTLSTISHSQCKAVEIIYAGADFARAKLVLRKIRAEARIEVRDYLALEDLAALCRSSDANIYIRSSKTFHHKLLELLSCGRPVIAYPGESVEAQELARQVANNFYFPPDEATLSNALMNIYTTQYSFRDGETSKNQFSWFDQSLKLEQVFKDAIGCVCQA